MLTAGVDLSAEDTKTCLAVVEWDSSSAIVTDLRQKVSNTAIVDTAQAVSKLGIDCPFGWPRPFVAFVNAHERGELVPPAGLPIDWRRRLANRTTDLVVRDEAGLVPLSVSADRIAHAAMRCAALLAELIAAGVTVDRTGRTGRVVEVYPAASLSRWGLTRRGYKGVANGAALNQLVDDVLRAAPWLSFGAHEAACRASDDAFDSVIAAMSSRAAALDLTTPPSPEQIPAAASEGWIALPVDQSLNRLVREP